MNMKHHRCGYFILLCSCLCFYLPISGSEKDEDDDPPKFVDYQELALKKLSMTTAASSTIDWYIAFLKLAPVAIHAVKEATQNSIDAGRYHFILLSRNKFVYDEDHYCIGMPENDDEFRRKIKEDERFKNIPDASISCKKHAKKWLWMLIKGDSNIFANLDEIRHRLENNANKYLWFVAQVQGIFDIFNDDVHSPASSLLDPKHVDLKKIGTYLAFLNKQVQSAMKIYYESDGRIVNLIHSTPNT